MAEVMGWAAAPARASVASTSARRPARLDEMYACADRREGAARPSPTCSSAAPWTSSTGSSPTPRSTGCCGRCWSFLAVNSTYKGPWTPGQRACLPSPWPCPRRPALLKKLDGGIGALTKHIQHDIFEAQRRRGAAEDAGRPGSSSRTAGHRRRAPAAARCITAPMVLSNLDPGVTFGMLLDPEVVPDRITERLGRRRPPGGVHPDALRPRRPARVRRALRVPQPARDAGVAQLVRARPRRCRSSSRAAAGARCPRTRRSAPRSRRSTTRPSPRRAARHERLRHVLPGRGRPRPTTAGSRTRWRQRIIAKLDPAGAELPGHPRSGTRRSRRSTTTRCSAAPGGDFATGSSTPSLLGQFRPGPRGWNDLPMAIDGLYLAGAGCHGGPGVTFIPGYNAGYDALDAFLARRSWRRCRASRSRPSPDEGDGVVDDLGSGRRRPPAGPTRRPPRPGRRRGRWRRRWRRGRRPG